LGEDDATAETSLPTEPPPTAGRRLLARLRRPRVHITRGRLLAFFLIFAFGSLFTAGTVVAVVWTDTPEFCGRCHTMGPEIKGHQISAHRAIGCGECHVEPGVEGWVKAKLNGTRQLFDLMTGAYPKPIPAPDHADLPSTAVTCARCHDANELIASNGPLKLVLETRFKDDETNTRQPVAFVLRPAGFGGSAPGRGVHWHIGSDVQLSSTDPRQQAVDLVRVTNPDGTTAQFIALGQVGVKTNVDPDVQRILKTERSRRMDCIDCHNRVGHSVPTIDAAVDDAMEAGQIDPTLPYIKQQAVYRLSQQYPSSAAADSAIDGLRGFYQARYPLVADSSAASINSAISELKLLYNLVATPDMAVGATTYANDLGHTSAPGCFRCHDGAHYKVVDGVMTDETIPSGCATCHTFPQIGPNNSAILIGQRPDTHNDRLWVFGHNTGVSTLDPAGTSCGACHTRSYCENCHNTPAVQVPHDQMVYNHAEVTRQIGGQACTVCHQPSYCAQCHAGDDVIGVPGSGSGEPPWPTPAPPSPAATSPP
jgi:nitrate/TMAO reductase-like tetraheme cytochrome c subunit